MNLVQNEPGTRRHDCECRFTLEGRRLLERKPPRDQIRRPDGLGRRYCLAVMRTWTEETSCSVRRRVPNFRCHCEGNSCVKSGRLVPLVQEFAPAKLPRRRLMPLVLRRSNSHRISAADSYRSLGFLARHRCTIEANCLRRRFLVSGSGTNARIALAISDVCFR